jgi:hypothetical protein
VPTLIAAREPLPDLDHDNLPQWAGHRLDLDYVLSTLMQRRDLRQRLQQQLPAA